MRDSMSHEELIHALESGEMSERLESWVPRLGAILLTLTFHNPQMITEDPEKVLEYLRIVTAKMPTEVLIAATMGLVQIQKVVDTPGMTPELYDEVQDAFRDIIGDDESK